MPTTKAKIRQILDRAEQGQTRPFLCTADDGEVYFVKGLDAGRGSLVSEWVAGRLAQLLGLPIPEFRLIEVEADFLEYSAFKEKEQLGSGVWFGSKRVVGSEELTWNLREATPQIWTEMPREWAADGCDVEFNTVKDLIWRFSVDTATFWRLP
jgi:hypothetical protein